VELLSGCAVAQSLLGGRGGVGEGKAAGVVVDQAEGQGGLAAGQAAACNGVTKASARVRDASISR
jgi:hypothetical protein